jgi:hypothetical protein
MAHTAQVTGEVNYREGDGPALTIRKGPIEVEKTEMDAILSWSETESEAQGESAEVRSRAALPLADYQRFVTEGAIREQT